MYRDARELSAATQLDCDLVIVGAGIAGLSLAHGLLNSTARKRRIIILESGDDEFIRAARQRPVGESEHDPEASPLPPDNAANRLNRGSALLHDAWGGQRPFAAFLHESRCRGLGGTGRLWGGKMAPLDPIDLETRRWLDQCEWPFDYAEFKPDLDHACELFQLPHFQAQAPIHPGDPRPPLVINQERNLTTGLRRYTAIAGRAQAARFAQFIDAIGLHPQVDCYLNATVVEICSAQSGAISALSCRSSNGHSFTIKAREYVLAAGGLENPRLLLHSRPRWPLAWRQHWHNPKLEHDPLGGYFMGHSLHRRPNHTGEFNQLRSTLPAQAWRLYWDKDLQQVQGILQLSARAQRRARLPNVSFTLESTPSFALSDETLPFNSHGYFMVEQLPHTMSRLRLLKSDEAAPDEYGVPRLHLDWRFQAADIDHLQRGAALIADELQRHCIASLHYQVDHDAVIHQIDIARHHIGTTRMHSDPAFGVLDPHCRVHGISNLYCIGASAFPTSGIANPTLAIVALSLRVAAHLKQSF